MFSLILPNFVFAQATEISLSDKKIGEKMLAQVPVDLEGIWKEKILPFLKKVYEWFKVNVWLKIYPRLKEEIEKRKPQIKEEFEKEKKEIKEELPEVTKSLWKRFKELIK